MGATGFYVTVKAPTAREAFKIAVEAARHEYGHGGYTGTIAEKDSFELFEVPQGIEPRAFIAMADPYATIAPEFERHRSLLNRIAAVADDKWGPAACVKTGEGEFAFFGMASE